MAIKYLKKKKMHSIMCDIFGIAPKMIDTHYNFHRGSEWLQCSYGGCCYEIFVSNGGAYLTSESKEYDWDADRYVNVNRKVYNGYGKYTYPIHEKCLAEEQETLKAEDLPFPEVMEQENKPWEMMDAEERADEFFNFPEEKPEAPEEPEQRSLLRHLLHYGQDPEKYILLTNGIEAIRTALVHEAIYPDKNLCVKLEMLRDKYTDAIGRMKKGWDGIVTKEALLDVQDWVDSRDKLLH